MTITTMILPVFGDNKIAPSLASPGLQSFECLFSGHNARPLAEHPSFSSSVGGGEACQFMVDKLQDSLNVWPKSMLVDASLLSGLIQETYACKL